MKPKNAGQYPALRCLKIFVPTLALSKSGLGRNFWFPLSLHHKLPIIEMNCSMIWKKIAMATLVL